MNVYTPQIKHPTIKVKQFCVETGKPGFWDSTIGAFWDVVGLVPAL